MKQIKAHGGTGKKSHHHSTTDSSKPSWMSDIQHKHPHGTHDVEGKMKDRRTEMFPDLSYRAINRAYYAKPLQGHVHMTRDDLRRESLLMKAFSAFTNGRSDTGLVTRDAEDALRDAE